MIFSTSRRVLRTASWQGTEPLTALILQCSWQVWAGRPGCATLAGTAPCLKRKTGAERTRVGPSDNLSVAVISILTIDRSVSEAAAAIYVVKAVDARHPMLVRSGICGSTSIRIWMRGRRQSAGDRSMLTIGGR